MNTIKKTGVLAPLAFMLLATGCYITEEPYPSNPKDDTPPQVVIAYPVNGSEVAGEVLIRAVATDNEGIQKVVLYVDGLPQPSEACNEPFELIWNSGNFPDHSQHAITARAYDHSENMTDSDPITLLINQSSLYPRPVKIYGITFADSAYQVSWSSAREPDFKSYTLLQSMMEDLSDEMEIYASATRNDTVFIVKNIPFDDTRYFRVRVVNHLGLVSYSPVEKAISSPGNAVPLDGLMAWFPFNGNALDESGNGHHGIVYDAYLTDDRYGNPNQAYDFLSNAGTIAIGGVDAFNNMDSFTIAAWVIRLMEYTGEHQTILCKVTPLRDFVLQLGPDGIPNAHFALATGASNFYFCFAPTAAPMNKWIHLAASWNGFSWKLYVNGIMVNSVTTPAGVSPPWTGEEMYIGSIGGGENFPGNIDEVMIYNRELSAQEIVGLAHL